MISIIDYKAGNLTSVKRALDHLGIECEITADANKIANAKKIIFPGVGHAESAMNTLNRAGLTEALKKAFDKGTPIMGICLGTQIILSHSEEGDTKCVGLIEGNCIKFDLQDKSLKIPHMGWNTISVKKEHYILKDINEGDELYFVHSYYPEPSSTEMVFATAEYEKEFPVAIGYKNLFATQFHPEKSGPVGLRILRNFSEWNGKNA